MTDDRAETLRRLGWAVWQRTPPDEPWINYVDNRCVDDRSAVPLCATYWGTHGCELERGHGGHHRCICCDCVIHPDPDTGCVGAWPYYGPDTHFYGEDVG